ncbi:MAG: hypothetical protein Q9182_006027 [Xanthomendoza sp. 2 TL-2023]
MLVVGITVCLGLAHPLVTTKERVPTLPRIDPRAISVGHGNNMRYYLNTLSAAFPDPIGMAGSSIYTLYDQTMTLLAQSRDTNSPSPTFGFSFGHLSLGFVTSNDAPIPWNTAIEFARKMQGYAAKGLLGVEYHAVVVDVALDITIEISLRILHDRPLRPLPHD